VTRNRLVSAGRQDVAVPARERPTDRAALKARQQLGEALTSIRSARLALNLSLDDVAVAVGLSPSQLSRTERGQVAVSIPTLARMAAAVGQELSVRCFAGGAAIRDRAQLKLLADFRAAISIDLRWATEVPMPNVGDARAWDGLVGGPGFRIGVDAETRIRDAQAVQRRVALKHRDSGVEHAILLVRDTRWNRQVLREAAASLQGSFPVSGSHALKALAGGRDPGGSAIVLL
jgi:transcriptional regulator with XRE-family HTH domain